MTASAHSDWIAFPRCSVTLNPDPSSACAAVAPSATITRGFTSRISHSSHGRHARTSAAVGFLCSRRRVSSCRTNLKCLTALVT